MEQENNAASLSKIAKDILAPNSGYFSRLLARLDKLVDDGDLAKAIFLAEFINNELDEYLDEFQGKGIAGLDDFYSSEEFKNRWLALKKWRDEIYSKLVKVQEEKGKEAVKKELSDYSGSITRYASK